MAIPKLHGTFRKINPRQQTIVADQAQRTKRNLVPQPRIDQSTVRQNVPLQRFGRNQEGSAKLSALLGIVGGAVGFHFGSAVQFNWTKETIAKNLEMPTDQLRFFDYLYDLSQISSGDYWSVLVAGAVGAFLVGGLGATFPNMTINNESR